MKQFTDAELSIINTALGLMQEYCNEPPHCESMEYCIFKDPKTGVCPMDLYAMREAVTFEIQHRQQLNALRLINKINAQEKK